MEIAHGRIESLPALVDFALVPFGVCGGARSAARSATQPSLTQRFFFV